MKLTTITPTKRAQSNPGASITQSGMLAFNAAAAQRYNLSPGQQVELARDESRPKSETLYVVFTGKKTQASRTITGKENYPGISIKSILNSLGMSSETTIYEYTISGELEVEGKRVLELQLEKKTEREK